MIALDVFETTKRIMLCIVYIVCTLILKKILTVDLSMQIELYDFLKKNGILFYQCQSINDTIIKDKLIFIFSLYLK